MKRIFMLGWIFAVLSGGCKPKTSPPEAEGHAIKSYDGRGIVRKIASDKHVVTIQHEAFPGYMPAMTMEFAVRNTNELAGINVNEGIAFKLMVHGDDDWIERIRPTGKTAPPESPPAHSNEVEIKPGDLMPDAEFLTEHGTVLRLSDYRGQVLAFTFFFTSCPLPDFCPRMSKNFAEARLQIQATPGAPTNLQFLSISFDPGFDKPEILSNYGVLYRGADQSHWLFATASNNVLAEMAPRLDLIIRRDGPGISHNLRTVVLDPHGRLHRMFIGNDWTPQQLADAMIEADRQ